MSASVACNLPQYLVRLDEKQKAAALDTDGYVIVNACAGAGKSAVLAARVAHLLDTGTAPDRILCVTFTNKADDEMAARIADYSGRDVSGMWIGTYHSVCVRILRSYGSAIGISSDFTIYDTADCLSVLRKTVKDLRMDRQLVGELQSEIERFKSQMLPIHTWCRDLAGRCGEDYGHKFRLVYDTYQQMLRHAGALDFGDLIRETVRLLFDFPDVRLELSAQFQYVCVDEYQDSNQVEAKLLELLSSCHGNLCVVGDVRQSIFRWRGSDYRLMLDFTRDYPGAKEHVLDTNYRSGKRIVEASEQLIAGSRTETGYKCQANRTDEGEVHFLRFESDEQEAQVIAGVVQDLVSVGRIRFRDVAILCRIRSVSRTLEDVFQKKGVSHIGLGRPDNFNTPEVEYALGYLRLVLNPYDRAALERIARLSPARETAAYERIIRTVARLRGMHSCGMTLKALVEAASKQVVLDLDLALDEDAKANLQRFSWAATRYPGPARKSLSTFLDGLLDPSVDDSSADAVRILTIHQSKGLQFKVIFVIGMDEGILPCRHATGDEEAMEEERRLCYVAMTRASECLCICSAATRLRGQRGLAQSRFLVGMQPICHLSSSW